VVRADAVGIVEESGIDHLLEVGEIIHHRVPLGVLRIGRHDTSRGKGTTDHKDTWVAAFDRLVGKAQHLDVALSLHTFFGIPLAVKVLFIPHFDSVDLALVPVDQLAHEADIQRQVIWRGGLRIGIEVRTRPCRRSHDAHHHLEATLVSEQDHRIVAAPVHLTRAGGEVVPTHLLLDPRQSQLTLYLVHRVIGHPDAMGGDPVAKVAPRENRKVARVRNLGCRGGQHDLPRLRRCSNRLGRTGVLGAARSKGVRRRGHRCGRGFRRFAAPSREIDRAESARQTQAH